MIKFLFPILLLDFWAFGQNITLNQIGDPDYQKKTNINRGLVVYKTDCISFVSIKPHEIYNLGNIRDSLYLEIRKSEKTNLGYEIKCKNCNEISFNVDEQNDSSFFRFNWKEDEIRFLISFEKSSHGLYTTKVNPEFNRDTTLGFIKFKNTFTHYSSLNQFGVKANLALIDKNFNGRIDDTDLIAISKDNYFMTVETGKSKMVKDVRLIQIDSLIFEINIVDRKKFIFNIKPSKKKAIPDLKYNSSVLDAVIDGKKVSEILKTKPNLVLFYFGSKYTDYEKDIKNLKLLSDKVELICVYDNIELPIDIMGFAIQNNVTILPRTQELKSDFDLNGYPSFLLIDNTGLIFSNLYNPNSIIELLK